MSYSLLVVDDEALTLRTISRALREEGYEVFLASSGEEALEVYAQEKPDLALVDVVLPGIDGIEVLRQIRKQNPAAIVLMMSAYHQVERAVEAMKLGAYDYMIKPFHLADLSNTIRRATETLALRVRLTESVQMAKGRYDFGLVVTHNEQVKHLLEVARKAAEADKTTILIQGESGTGKEVLAKAIHYHSPRAQGPLLQLNCAAIPDTLLESELFGYEPGAFTDARRRKEGLLERASHGTLFLDEIGDMSMSTQAKLLRVLEEGSFTRLGGTRPISVDVRIIAATNKDLKAAIAEGKFREDLYYRLNVVPLFLHPLRDRKEDIVPLALDILQRFNRELKNVIERTMILAPEGDIDAAYLPEEIRDYIAEVATGPVSHSDELSPTGHQFVTLRELEERYIDEVLNASGQNKTQAAHILGIHPTSLLRRLKKQHLDN